MADVVAVVSADVLVVSVLEEVSVDGGGPGGGAPAPVISLPVCEPKLFASDELIICAITAAIEAPICAEPAEKSTLDAALDEADDVVEADELLETLDVLAAAA